MIELLKKNDKFGRPKHFVKFTNYIDLILNFVYLYRQLLGVYCGHLLSTFICHCSLRTKLFVVVGEHFIPSQNCRIKFLVVPVYPVSLYNDIKGQKNPTLFLDSETEVESQANFLNQHIEQINLQLGRNTLKFNADLRDIRRGKKRYFFELLPDRLHPGCLLAQKWLQRLELDIVKECYPPKDTVEVDEQEFLAL